MARRKMRRVDPTQEWEQIELLCVWNEQRDYERIRPLVLFGGPVPERSVETGISERVLYRRIAAFREGGMGSLLGTPRAKRRVLPPAIRRKIVDLKAEHPPAEPRRDRQHLRGALRPQARRPDRQGRPGGECPPPQARQAVSSLPRGAGRSGEQGGRRDPPPGGLVGQEHRALPSGGPLHRLAGEAPTTSTLPRTRKTLSPRRPTSRSPLTSPMTPSISSRASPRTTASSPSS